MLFSDPEDVLAEPSGSSSLKNDAPCTAVDSAASETAVSCAIESAASADFGWARQSSERRRDHDRLSRRPRNAREDVTVFSEQRAHGGTAERVDHPRSWSCIDQCLGVVHAKRVDLRAVGFQNTSTTEAASGVFLERPIPISEIDVRLVPPHRIMRASRARHTSLDAGNRACAFCE